MLRRFVTEYGVFPMSFAVDEFVTCTNNGTQCFCKNESSNKDGRLLFWFALCSPSTTRGGCKDCHDFVLVVIQSSVTHCSSRSTAASNKAWTSHTYKACAPLRRSVGGACSYTCATTSWARADDKAREGLALRWPSSSVSHKNDEEYDVSFPVLPSLPKKLLPQLNGVSNNE